MKHRHHRSFRETRLRGKRIFQGNAVGFHVDTVRLPNGRLAPREYLDHPGAVGVIPLLPGRKTILVRQYRYPVNRSTWEIPAGKLDPGESPTACIQRELEEETGWRAGHLRKLFSFWPTAAFSNEIIHLYVGTALTPGRQQPDPDEFLDAAVWPLARVYDAIAKGRIRDSKTVIAFLAFKSVRE